MTDEDVARFWARVDRDGPGGCWLMTGGHNGLGYVQFQAGGVRRVAHRVAFELERGPIPDGLVLDHLCREPRCVNPAHLEPVTQRENTMRGVGPTSANAGKTRCPKCGQDYTRRPDGTRYCHPCKLAYFREYNATRRK